MDYKGIKILILEGYARQCLPFMRSLRKLGCEITLLCNSKSDLGYWSNLPKNKILGVCDPERYEESSEYICNLIKNGNFDLVIPLVDFSAKILSRNKEELKGYAKIASNDCEVFEQAQDKLSVMEICEKNHIPSPKTLTYIQDIDDIKNQKLTFPIVVKPRQGYGARGFHCFENEKQLYDFFENENVTEYVIQEYIPQTDSNLAVCLFIDNNGEVKANYTYCSRRWFPLKGGTGTLNELIDRPDAVATCKKLAKILDLKGIVGFDLIEDKRDGIAKVIEVNPRILACATIGFLGGVDQGKLILQKEFGEVVEEQTVCKKKLYVRMSQIDLLWFLKSPERWKAKPSWFNLCKTKDQTFYWSDPLPWFAFMIAGVRRYKREMKKRS